MHVLDTLLIGGTRITERGVEELAKLRKLRKLRLFDTQIGDSAVQLLAAFPSLEVVLIGRSKSSGDGARAIQAAKPTIKFTGSARRRLGRHADRERTRREHA